MVSLNPLHHIRSFAAKLPARLETLFARHTSPLLRGDLVGYAERQWPREQYPTAWVDIPDDLRLPLIWDGWLLNSDSPAELAKAYVTPDLVATVAARAGVRAFIFTAIIGAVLVTFSSLSFTLTFATDTPYPQWAADAGVWLPILSWYVLKPIEFLWALIGLGKNLANALLPLPLLFFPLWTFAFAAGMARAWSGLSHTLRLPTREAGLLWKANALTREKQYAAYKDQVEQATGWLADLPTIPLGKAAGLQRSRWDNLAPARGQIIGWDIESLMNHVFASGPTGAGKTRDFMIPMFRRTMDAFKQMANVKLGCYVTDGKGVLYKDLLPLVADRKDDIAVLGTGDDHFGLNIVRGMEPMEIASTFIGVAGQVNGESKDNLWNSLASGLLMHAAMIARGLEMDEDTVAEWINAKGFRPYSLLGIAQIATEERASQEAIDRITSIMQGADEGRFTREEEADLMDSARSCDWFEQTHLPRAHETRSSISANISAVLETLVGARELSKRFCSGVYDREVDVDHALKGGLLFVAISQAEHGIAGKVVMIWLKSRLFVMARRREKRDKERTGDALLQMGECAKFPCAFFVDEAQELLSVGACGDNEFWNVARSAKVFAVMASQTFATIYERMGQAAADNFLEQMRTKVFIKTEEKATVQAARAISGEAPRGWETEYGFYATATARETLAGSVGRARISFALLDGIKPIYFVPMTNVFDAYSADHLWARIKKKGVVQQIAGLGGGGGGGEGTAISVQTRHEDRNRAAMVEGVQYRPRIEADELKIGGGYAYVTVQRAGGERRDLVDLRDIAA
jgi:hypothetical protein